MVDYRRATPTMPMLFTGGYIIHHIPIMFPLVVFNNTMFFSQIPKFLMCKHNPINHHHSHDIPWVPQSHHQSPWLTPWCQAVAERSRTHLRAAAKKIRCERDGDLVELRSFRGLDDTGFTGWCCMETWYQLGWIHFDSAKSPSGINQPTQEKNALSSDNAPAPCFLSLGTILEAIVIHQDLQRSTNPMDYQWSSVMIHDHPWSSIRGSSSSIIPPNIQNMRIQRFWLPYFPTIIIHHHSL